MTVFFKNRSLIKKRPLYDLSISKNDRIWTLYRGDVIGILSLNYPVELVS